ncbi:MAG: hypothetical protein KTR31_29275 [Myxococcales bacterium]|nr:hypothetical protein [Myxococcales bacterium]
MLFFFAAQPALAAPFCQLPRLREHPPAVASFKGGGRPASSGVVDSKIYPVRVHYRRPVDAERAEKVVLPALETAWAVQIDQVGWPAPPPDAGRGGSNAYDVYLTNEETYGGAYVYGFGPDVIDGDDWYSVPTYMALDEGIADAEMASFVAHELNHASQYTIDAWEWSTFVWEATAEVMADVVDDKSNDYIGYGAMEDFQEFPFLSLAFDGYRDQVVAVDPYSFYEYGGIVFGMFVEERYGTGDGTTLLALWDALAQPTQTYEPDFVDALATLDDGTSAAELYTEFALWRMFAASLDDGAHFEEAALWGEGTRVGAEASLTLDQVDGTPIEPVEKPYELGTSYVFVDLGEGTDELLRVDAVGQQDVQWSLVWAVWTDDGPARTGTIHPGEPLQVDIDLAGGTLAAVGVVNTGRETFDPDQMVIRRTFQLSLSTVPPGTSEPTDTDGTDTGTPTEPEPAPQSCGCRSLDPTGAWVIALALPLLSRRRRGVR